MLQHGAALCQPIHARLAHFAPLGRSQFPHRPPTPPCERTGTRSCARFPWGTQVSAVAVVIGHQSSGRRRPHSVPETADPVVEHGPGHPLALGGASRARSATGERLVPVPEVGE